MSISADSKSCRKGRDYEIRGAVSAVWEANTISLAGKCREHVIEYQPVGIRDDNNEL